MAHKNIVGIHDAGVSEVGAFLVMDYIEGNALDLHFVGGECDCVEVAELFVKICDAIHAAHLKGVIHRDLKPSNILVDEQGEPHVLDFGLAKFGASEEAWPAITEAGQFLGTLWWAAPEQAGLCERRWHRRASLAMGCGGQVLRQADRHVHSRGGCAHRAAADGPEITRALPLAPCNLYSSRASR